MFSNSELDTGAVYTWGAGGYGQLGHNTKVQHQLTPKKVDQVVNGIKFVDVDGGTWHSIALTGKLRITKYVSPAIEGGEVYTWGAGGYGQLV